MAAPATAPVRRTLKNRVTKLYTLSQKAVILENVTAIVDEADI